MDEHQKALALSLVHAHVSDNEEYTSWVPAYTSVRERGGLVTVGGHFRRKALYRRLLSALRCTCRFQDLSRLPPLCAPPRAAKRRWDENGRTIRVKDRQLEFF